MANKDALEKKLSEMRKEQRELSIRFGRMATTPKSDPSYSSAKMQNMQMELDKLDEKINDLEGQLLELDQGPDTSSPVKPKPSIAMAEPPKAQAELEVKPMDPELEARTKKAAKEIEQLLERSDKRAVAITKAVYALADLLQEQEEDWRAAVKAVQVNPDKLSAWQIRESFPMHDLLKVIITVQHRLRLLRRDLLDKAGLPPVW
jgi:DNA repair exonuclease SbcCD ATPase subunit